jgi:DNA-binding CsgD family transcriptional regulator
MRVPERNRPPSTDELLDLVGQIYASATEPDNTLAPLGLFNEIVGGTSAHAFTWQRSTGKVLHSRFSESDAGLEEANRQYLGQWGAVDPRAASLAGLPAGEVLRCHERFDDQFVAASSFYSDYFIPRGFRWSLAGVVDAGADTVTAVTAIRVPDQPPFEDWTAAALRTLLPHFQKAASMRARAATPAPANRPAMEMLRVLPVPCLFTDHAGRCIERNQAFDTAADLLSLRLVVGRVRFADPKLQATWETALSETHATALGQTFSALASNGKQWRVQLIPMHSVMQDGDALDKKMILVVFDRKDQDAQPTVELLALGARLTRAELDVATGLLQGLPAKVIAKQRGASFNTVRSQIVAILEKTGYKSQRELIAALGASAFGASSFFASSFQSTSFAPDSIGSAQIEDRPAAPPS